MCTSNLCEIMDDVCYQGSTKNNILVITKVRSCIPVKWDSLLSIGVTEGLD